MAQGTMQKVTNNSQHGYCKMPDGTLIQYGLDNQWSSNPKLITFPMSFYTRVPIVASSCGAGSTRTPVYVEGISLSGFEAYRGDGSLSNLWIRWIAIGRWKA